MSELESRKLRGGENIGNPYLYFSPGVGFVIATILVIVTSGTAAAGLPFVIAAAALFGIGLSGTRVSNAPFDHQSARSGNSCPQ